MNYLLPLDKADRWAVNPLLPLGLAKYNENHDERGRFASGDGGGGGGGGAETSHAPAAADIQATEVPIAAGYNHHVTNLDGLEGITERGIKLFGPSHGTDQGAWPDGSTERRAYFTNSQGMLRAFAPEHGQGVVVRAKTGAAKFKRESGTGDIYVNKPIKASDLEYLGADSKWYPLASLKKLAGPMRALYIKRRLLNAGAIRAWAASQGIASTLSAADMHTTVAYSREPVDWSALIPEQDAIVVLDDGVAKYNLNHDERGRFAEGDDGDGVGGGSYSDMNQLQQAVLSSPLTGDEKKAINYYATWKGAENVNQTLQLNPGLKGNRSDARAVSTIHALDRVFARAGAHDDITLYRGVSGGAWDSAVRAFAQGKVSMQRSGYTSTSVLESVARGYSTQAETGYETGKGGVFEIRVGKGIPILPLPSRGKDPSAEVLLGRGTKFRIVSLDKKARRAVLEIVGAIKKRAVRQFPAQGMANGALVLEFESRELRDRWQELRDAGASWDYAEYRPHVTITYLVPEADVDKIEPYRGPLIFGPEEFEEVEEGWAGEIDEEPLVKRSVPRLRSARPIP